MTRFYRLLATAVLLGCLGSGAAQAQAPGVGRGAPARGVAMQPPLPDPATSAGNLGTRLEPGAVLCRSPEGLRQRQAAMAARSSGDESQATLPAGCVLLAARTPVEVLERRGFGLIQVKTLGRHSETGWTDAYLPPRRN